MSYRHRKRYRNMRERNAQFIRKLKFSVLLVVVILAALLYFNWTPIFDYYKTYFY